MAKVRIDESDTEWSIEFKKGDGFEKVWSATSELVSYTYDEFIFDKYNLTLWAFYILITIVGACFIVYTLKCLCLCNSVRKTQNELLEKKISANNKKLE